MLATTSAVSTAPPRPHAVPLPHQADETLTGDHTHAGRQAVEKHQRHRGQHENPQQLVAVVGAEHRIRRDARRIVIGQAGKQSRTGYRQQSAQSKPFAPWAIHGFPSPPARLPLAGA